MNELKTKLADLVLALRAREALDDWLRIQQASSLEHEAWHREALWDSYPNLSELAYEIECTLDDLTR